MNNFKFGDYPYNNEIIEMPNRSSLYEFDISTCPKCYFSEEFIYSLNDNIEKWKNPDLSEMSWFRWITGHQTMLIFWYVLSKELWTVVNSSNLKEIEQKLKLCAKILEAGSVVFEYTGSCPEHFYHSTIRPYMALFHKGFSGKWSVDYESIPELVNQILKTNYPDSQKHSQQEFQQSFIQHQKSHYGVAKRLVPSSASLLKEAKNTELEVTSTEEHNILFDYFFLVKRVNHPNPSLLLSLSKRIKAIILDLKLNGFYEPPNSDSSQFESSKQGSSKYQEDLKLILFEAANAVYTLVSTDKENVLQSPLLTTSRS